MKASSGTFALKMIGGLLLTAAQIFLGFFGGPLIVLSIIVLPAPILFLVALFKPGLWEKKGLRLYLTGAAFCSLIGSCYVVGFFLLHSS